MDTREFAPEDEDLRGVGRRIGAAAVPSHPCLVRHMITDECDCRTVEWLHDASWDDIEQAVRATQRTKVGICLAVAKRVRADLRERKTLGPMWFHLRFHRGVGDITRDMLNESFRWASRRCAEKVPPAWAR